MKKYNKLLENKFVKKNADINCLVGEYIVIGNSNVKSFELKKENIVKIKACNGHKLGCCKEDNDEYVYGIKLFKNYFLFRFLPFFPIILHKNGVIRFTPLHI
jgi:hypothetical protein